MSRFVGFVSRGNGSSVQKGRKLSKHAPKHIRLGLWLHTRRLKVRLAYFGLAGLVVFSLVAQIMTVLLVDKNYKLSAKAQMVIGESSSFHANSLKFDPKTNTYEYNKDYKPGVDVAGASAQPRFSASFDKTPEKGVRVDDPVSQTSVTFKPDFPLAPPKQVENRLLYPIKGQNAVKVYTLKTIGFKEDIVLNSNSRDTLEYAYKLELPQGSEARLEHDGSVGVYGVSQTLLSNVSTSTEKDAELLEKARTNAPKNTLLYTIPSPVVREFDTTKSQVKSWFTLEGDTLTVHATNLKSASYPLSIDPSVYVETAAKLMRGNNETNIGFDVDNELIQKGETTGARFNEWDSTMALNEGRWNHATAAAGGYVYSLGGSKSNVTSQTFSTVGADTFTVPAGITSITVKMWGGGGGGGGGGDLSSGGNGGGGGFSQATLAVTPSENLDVFVGGGGGFGVHVNNSGGGGGGGGRSLIARGATNLVVAPGGGGGGGGDNSSSTAGGAGGAGGGTSGVSGASSSASNGGGGGTDSAGGSGGTGGNNSGTSGAANNGGAGADGRSGEGADGSGSNGGNNSGAAGGSADANANGYAGGGGGGGGRFGGGGGSGSQAGDAGGGGGGGGSGLASGTLTTLTAGSGSSPGNASDPSRGTAGEGGSGGAASGSGSTGNAGVIVISYSSGGGANTTESTLAWAQLSTTNNAITSPNPGTGSCAGWCEDNDYDLPAPRKGLSLVAYNGFLYALGGVDGSGNISNSVFIAKLGVNGEPSLWHPTDTNKNNWDYWYTAGNLSSERSYAAAVAYNNRLYLLGGQTDVGGLPTAVDTVEVANINPNGDLDSWMAVTDMPSVRFGHGAQVYNDYLYLIGGNSSGTLQDTVSYIKINSDGTLVSSWATTNAFTTARQSWGGNFTTIYGGYLYLMGGCSAVNGSGYCTTIADDVQLVSINADGSVGNWRVIGDVNTQRIGFSLVAWNNAVYRIGGCSSQDASTGDCLNSLTENDYGVINPDGDASTVALTQPSGSGNCVGGDPYGCDLPPAGDDAGEIGQMLSATAIMNGYLYVIGGCTDTSGTDCTAGDAVSSNTAYAAISSDGTLHRSPSCVGSYYGSWCVDNTNLINSTTGLMAASTAVFEGRIYIVGGIDNSTTGTASVFSIAINSDGSLSSDGWNQQSFSNLGISGEIAYSYSYARANPTSAQTYPGNLYIFGGCGDVGSGLGCSSSSYRSEVYKCNIQTDGLLEETTNTCTTSGQLQIDAELEDETDEGLGTHSGAVYANYIYLVGGISPAVLDRDTVFYAKFDNNNNVVSVDTEAAGGDNDDWKLSESTMSTGRRRGASFGYNGYLYVLGGFDGGGGVGDIEFAKFNVSTGDIEPFTSSTVTTGQRWGLGLVVSNSYAYMIGGCTASSGIDCSSMEDSLQIFQIYNNNSGTPAGYASAPSGSRFATDRFGAGTVIHNGFIYIAGGCVASSDCVDATSSVEYAPLNDDGTIGSWSTATGSLPGDRVFGQLEQAGGTFYFVGGQDDSGTAQSTVYYATPSGNGDISSWSTATNGLPDERTELSAAVWNNRIFVTGGADDSPAVSNAVYVSPQLNSGGDIGSAWSSTTAFNVARSSHTAIAYANNLYIIGGYDGTAHLSDVQFTQINSDGSLDSWTYTTSLPQRVRLSDGFAANGYMYLFGGKLEDLTCTNNTFVAPISANTTVASGNNPTGIGEWFVTNERFTGERSGVAAAYGEGKAYVLGGACGSLEAGTGSTVVEDDFDPTTDGTQWSSTANMANGTVCGTISSGNSLYSTGDDDAVAETIDVDVLYGGTVSFYLRIPTSNSGSCDAPNSSNEDVVLEYSNNGGSGWTTIATYQNTQFNTPTLVEETIPTGARTSSTRFRLHMVNADNNDDDWAIDDFEIVANTTPPITEVLEDDFDPSIDGADWVSTSGMSVGSSVCGTISSGNSLYSNGGPTANAVTTDVDLRYGGMVQFWLRIPTNSGGGCDTPESGEDLQLQYSTNGGGAWTTYATYDENDYNTPQEVTAVIPQAAYAAAVRFRWIIPNATSGSFDMWAIDDVSVSAFGSVLAYTNQNRVVYTTLLSQPQVAKYSRMIDTDTDVFPNTWLMNGIDNSIGARWNVRYRSMHDLDGIVNPNEDCGTSGTMPTMTTWGQDTDFGGVSLGKVEPYVPKNDSGGNINCARYYYFFVEIDASQTFGYPEDISRGPTLTDLSLFFTSDPSKRLRHGKTFTGGEQQPLDTPCRAPSNPLTDPNRNNCYLDE